MSQSTSLKIQTISGSLMSILILLIIVLNCAHSAPLSIKHSPYYSPKNPVTIIVFYTTWCPPCTKSLQLLDDIHTHHPAIAIKRICVDDTISQTKALPFGLAESVPLILVADHDGNVIKRFKTLPNKTIFSDLIQRLEEGRLENGTLPPEQRIDSWKQNRKGM